MPGLFLREPEPVKKGTGSLTATLIVLIEKKTYDSLFIKIY